MSTKDTGEIFIKGYIKSYDTFCCIRAFVVSPTASFCRSDPTVRWAGTWWAGWRAGWKIGIKWCSKWGNIWRETSGQQCSSGLRTRDSPIPYIYQLSDCRGWMHHKHSRWEMLLTLLRDKRLCRSTQIDWLMITGVQFKKCQILHLGSSTPGTSLNWERVGWTAALQKGIWGYCGQQAPPQSAGGQNPSWGASDTAKPNR